MLINLVYDLASGEPLTPERMQELIAKADGEKREKALLRLQADNGRWSMNGMWSSARPKGWPRHGYQKRAGRSSSASWRCSRRGSFRWQFEWDGMQKYYLAHYVVASTGLFHKYLVLHTVDRKGKWHPDGPG